MAGVAETMNYEMPGLSVTRHATRNPQSVTRNLLLVLKPSFLPFC
jgi:hypothetical protein